MSATPDQTEASRMFIPMSDVVDHPDPPGLTFSNRGVPELFVPDEVNSFKTEALHTAVIGVNRDGVLDGVPMTFDGVHPSSDGSRR